MAREAARPDMSRIGRRSFLRRSALAAGGAAVTAGPLAALVACSGSERDGRRGGGEAPRGYGELVDMGDLWLPEGFRYMTFGLEGSALAVTRGGSPEGRLPRGHDGMASFAVGAAGLTRLVRNHENERQVSPLGGPDSTNPYDPQRYGGTTTVEFDAADPADADRDDDRFRGQWVSLQGTSTNCAGGPTPWGSWMTCEETVEEVDGIPHGYVFEVPSGADAPVDPVPLKAMGRFEHEAVAIDPRTEIAYQTEDRRSRDRSSGARLEGEGSGFYRFVPAGDGAYGTEGRLEMLAVEGRPNLHTATGVRVGEVLTATWVPIRDPDPAGAIENPQAVSEQGWERGAAVFDRLEGAWFGGGSAYFTSTNGGVPSVDGAPGLGQVWQYTPRGADGGELRLLVQRNDGGIMEAPDNVTVSPRGGLLCCEDGEGTSYLRGVTPDGLVFDFSRHALPGDGEFAGANWSPDGAWLFVNVQDPGTTFAITGPWERGTL